MRTPATLISIVLAACVAGCGTDDGGVSPLAGPPAWWAAREDLGDGVHAINLRAGAPCDVVLILEGVDEGRRALPPRRLSSGETVRVWWSPDDRALGQAVGDDADAGRTEPHLAGLEFGYADTGAMSESAPLWTRPERGQVARGSVLPPPTPEPLPFGVEIELYVVAVADLDEGRSLRVLPRAEGHRVRPAPDALKAPERARVMRFKLLVRPADAP